MTINWTKLIYDGCENALWMKTINDNNSEFDKFIGFTVIPHGETPTDNMASYTSIYDAVVFQRDND
jgi:hypothetical protein